MTTRFISSIFAFVAPISLILTSCQAVQNKKVPGVKPSAQTESALKSANFPSLQTQFACLPTEAAFLAAHRGNARDMGLAENALPSLKALYEAGIMIAEIDVAGLKDGVHILYHDGVWEDDSTGQGPVASTTWADAQGYLIRDNRGKLTSATPPKLDDVLDFAKGRMYLEIDFKSSAKYDVVIDAINTRDMGEQVILIAYNDKQAKALSALAPDMMLSISERDAKAATAYHDKDLIAAWGGRLGERNLGPNADGFALLGMARPPLDTVSGPAALIVTDYAFRDKSSGDYPGILGLTANGQNQYETCLASK